MFYFFHDTKIEILKENGKENSSGKVGWQEDKDPRIWKIVRK